MQKVSGCLCVRVSVLFEFDRRTGQKWHNHHLWHSTAAARRSISPSVRGAWCNGVFTRSSKRPANFQQMYSKYTC